MLFKEIVGQEEIKKRLIQTVTDNRVSHAQLFLGKNGIGKLALAIAYAQYINCKAKSESDACGVCPSCLKYEKLAHPDLHFIYPVAATKEVKTAKSEKFIDKWRALLLEKNQYISINEWHAKIEIENKQGIINRDDCNSIIKTLGYKSYEAEYKVMIIWMAEKLFHAAAPKLLKILEEPPEKTLFILIAENQEQIINTIISRTQIIKIPNINDESLTRALIDQKECKLADAEIAVNLANGSFKNAVKNIQYSEEERINFNYFVKWMRLCYENKIPEIVNFVADISKIGRERQKTFLSYALRAARNSILINFNNPELVKLEAEELKFINKFSPFINNSNIEAFANELNSAIYAIERNANPSILFLDLSLKSVRLLKVKP
ncbi:MAG: DNA polymerase III subunit delta [Bacteroidetes bacterium]|nr:DNA polymerase III subunit delta [Bacteroidota bacterium]